MNWQIFVFAGRANGLITKVWQNAVKRFAQKENTFFKVINFQVINIWNWSFELEVEQQKILFVQTFPERKLKLSRNRLKTSTFSRKPFSMWNGSMTTTSISLKVSKPEQKHHENIFAAHVYPAKQHQQDDDESKYKPGHLMDDATMRVKVHLHENG